jgi:hypothetical protein
MYEQMEENIKDENNDYDYNCEQFNEYDEYNEECEQNNDINDENEYNNDNLYLLKDQENIQLKNKIEELNNLLFQKNKELEEIRIKNDNQLIKINKTFDKHINEYQRLVQNYSNLQKELKNKNQIINNLQNNLRNNDDFNNNGLEDKNLILLINQKLKNIYQNVFKESNIFNENEYNNKNINEQIQILVKNIDYLSNKLMVFKNNNNNEILKLKNILKERGGCNNSVDPKFYINFINIMNEFYNSIPNNMDPFNNLPNYSIKDNSDKIYKDILITIKTMTNYILSITNDKNEFNSYNNPNNMNNKYNEELNKRLKEMSELLIKSNEYLNKSRQENNELKQRYNELEKRHNLTIKDISSIDNNKDRETDRLINELNKKNQQIKSLEHMISRLTKRNNKNNTSNIINMNSKSMLNDSSYYGKIINKKTYNEIKNIQNQSSFYLNNNKFVKDAKNETNLKNFLDKYTNGEYGNISKIKDNKNNESNKFIINLKDEIENYEKLNKAMSDSEDEIDKENNYNEEEEERKYQMEGKIHN